MSIDIKELIQILKNGQNNCTQIKITTHKPYANSGYLTLISYRWPDQIEHQLNFYVRQPLM